VSTQTGEAPAARDAVAAVIRREYVERIRDRGFLISTGVVVVVILLITVLPRVLGAGDDPDWKVATAGQGSDQIGRVLPGAAEASGAKLEVRSYPDPAAAERAVRDGDADLALLDGKRLVSLGDPPAGLLGLIQATTRELRVRQTLTDAGVDQAKAQEALAAAPLPLSTLRPSGNADKENVARLASIILYFQLISYGFAVASGVVEEKSSRVVELLLATIRPSQLLTGKVIGIGLLGLTQLLFLGVVGMGTALALHVFSVPASVLGTVADVVLWFLLGFAFWATVFAAAGAMVSRQEELQNTTTPLTLILVAGFLIAITVGSEPDSLLATVCSFLPPVAPLIMPLRVAAGEVPAWQFVLAVAVMLGSTAALIPVAARIYAGAVLRTGARVRLGQALRSR
jgi:ABC-2 type transport system permease protein